MDFKILCVLLTLLSLAHTSKILAILDNKLLEETHWKFFDMLRKEGELEIAYSFGRDKIELKYYDRFRYDHIVVIATSAKGTLCISGRNRQQSQNQRYSVLLRCWRQRGGDRRYRYFFLIQKTVLRLWY